MTALTFELHPTLESNGSLKIRVESPSGQVTETRPIKGQQLERWLASARAFIPDNRQAWRGTSGSVESAMAEARAKIERSLSANNITAVGRELSSVVFRGQIRTLYDQSVGRAEEAGKALRIHCHFELDDPREARLATLPWEQLYDPVRGDYIALDDRTSVSRFLRYPGVARKMRLPQVLHVLVVTASPGTMTKISSSFPPDEKWPQAHIVVERLVDPDAETLETELGRGVHVLHIDSHGTLDAVTGLGSLALVKTGSRKVETVTGPQLADWVRGNPVLRVVVLNACQSAGSSGRRAFADVSSALVRAGVPAVIGMRDVIPDADAVRFARALYTGLNSGRTLEASVSSARRALHSAGSPFWSWPTFYSHAAEAFSIPVDVKAGMTRVFSWLGALTAAMSINACSRSQGGPPLVPGIDYSMVNDESAPMFGALVVGALLWALLLITVRYQWASAERGLFFRLPIAFGMPVSANRVLAAVYQLVILFLFLLVPLYVQMHSLNKISRESTWLCDHPYTKFAQGSMHLTRYASPVYLFDHEYCFGPKKVERLQCDGSYGPCGTATVCEVSFAPFWLPWVLLLVGVCNLVLFVLVLVGISAGDAYRWSGWVFRARSWLIGLCFAAVAMSLAVLQGPEFDASKKLDNSKTERRLEELERECLEGLLEKLDG